jgi:flagellar motility protein MotE (MotC chaperone)
MSKLLIALQEREEKVKKREVQQDVRQKALDVVGEEVAKRIDALENAEIQLRGTLALADGAAEKDLARLTLVYENMKPKDASALFEAMEPDFAAGFLGRMRPEAAASVLAGLTPAAAYSISVILASRNANVPKS